MSIFEWSDSFLLRVPQIDDHHKQLVELLNRAYDGFMNNAADTELIALIDQLELYTVYHFEAEELMMEEHDYPQLDDHKAGHDSFKRMVADFKDAVQCGDRTIELELLQFLKNWLAAHILTSDKDFGLYISFNSLSD